MDHDFWRERWQQNQIGFHSEAVNEHLKKYWSSLNLPQGATVLVPLCGKSKDVLWLLHQGYQVIGVELSPLAVTAFFTENQLTPKTYQHGNFTVSEVSGLQIFCGDFFELALPDTEVAAVYDRAALVALPADMRSAYVAQLRKLLNSNSRILLVTFSYLQEQMAGPPFSVTQAEVYSLYAGWSEVGLLHTEEVLEREPRFRQQGLMQLSEQVYDIRVK